MFYYNFVSFFFKKKKQLQISLYSLSIKFIFNKLNFIKFESNKREYNEISRSMENELIF